MATEVRCQLLLASTGLVPRLLASSESELTKQITPPTKMQDIPEAATDADMACLGTMEQNGDSLEACPRSTRSFVASGPLKGPGIYVAPKGQQEIPERGQQRRKP